MLWGQLVKKVDHSDRTASTTAASGPPRSKKQPAAAPPSEDAAPPDALRLTLDLTSAVIVHSDRKGRILYATPALARMVGREPQELLGMTFDQLVRTLDSEERSTDRRERVLRGGETVRETLTVDLGGERRDVEFTAVPVRGPDGEVGGTVVTAFDVTELRRVTRRMTQLDRVHTILVDTNQAIVRTRDRDRLFAEVCRIAVEVGGFSLAWIGVVEPDGSVRIAAGAGPDLDVLDGIVVSVRDEPSGRGVVGRAIRENRVALVEDAQNDPRMAAWQDRMRNKGFSAAAAFPICRGGVPFAALALYSPEAGYFDAEELTLFEELASDLSYALESIEAEERKVAAEDALRDSERRYRDLFEQSPNSMWVFDMETLRFLAVNDAAVATYGYSREEFLAMTIAGIRPAEEIPTMLQAVAEARTRGLPPRGLWRHVRKDGAMMDVEVTGHDVTFDGRPARLISAIDVTEKRRLEAHLAEAARMEAMGHLAGGIAHDFNNLLTAVNGYSDLLVGQLGDSPLAEDAREIRRAGERAANLTKQVLAFARRTPMAPQPVDLNQVVAGVGQMLRRLIGEQIQLTIKLESEPAVVMADPGQLEQVLVNLAINARDAMPGGGDLEMAVAAVPEAAALGHGSMAGPGLLLTVTDNGVGMDAGTLARAFEPFFTTKAPGTGPGSGTGLGLATVYGIVHQSNGEIWADSVVGRGTRVSVLLGRVDETPEPVSEIASQAVGPAVPATVLVVEDEAAVRALVVSALERAGYRVLVAGSPAEALALTEGLDLTIELLVTDVIMPEIHGQVLAERLLARRPGMRVILMSGYGASLGPIPTSGPYHFMAKPFGRDQLTDLVAKVLAEP